MSKEELNIIDGADGRKIAYRRGGEGKPLVLLHGITESSKVFEPVIKNLAKDHEIIAIDMAGHGESSAPEIVTLEEMAADAGLLIHTLGLDAPLLIGHSYGAMVASALGANGVGSGIILIDQMFELSAFREALLANRELLEGENFHPFIDQLFLSLGMDKLDKKSFELLSDLHAKAEQDFVLAQWAGVLADNMTPLAETIDGMLHAIKVPVLSLHSMEENEDYRKWFIERVPQAQVEFWGDLSHWPHLTQSENFCQRVREFDPR